jgi:hypothetical protein
LLNNRVLARSCYERVPDIVMELAGDSRMQTTHVRDHGLLGPVRLVRDAMSQRRS